MPFKVTYSGPPIPLRALVSYLEQAGLTVDWPGRGEPAPYEERSGLQDAYIGGLGAAAGGMTVTLVVAGSKAAAEKVVGWYRQHFTGTAVEIADRDTGAAG